MPNTTSFTITINKADVFGNPKFDLVHQLCDKYEISSTASSPKHTHFFTGNKRNAMWFFSKLVEAFPSCKISLTNLNKR